MHDGELHQAQKGTALRRRAVILLEKTETEPDDEESEAPGFTTDTTSI